MFIALHAHPVFYILIGAISFIVAHECCHWLLPLYTSIALGLIIFFIRLPWLRLIVCMILLGGLASWWRLNVFKNRYVCATDQLKSQLVDKKLKSVTAKISGYEYRSCMRWPCMITLEIQSVNNNELPLLNGYTLQCYGTYNVPLQLRDTIKINNVKLNFSKKIFHQNSLARIHCLATTYIPWLDYELIARPQYNIKRWIHQSRLNLWRIIRSELKPKTYSFVASIFGGNKDGSKEHIETIKQLFKHWGLSHQLVRSGLHITLFVGLCYRLLSLLGLSLLTRRWVIIIMLVLYSCMSWINLSFLRALVMISMASALRVSNHQVNMMHIISLVSVVSLMHNPLHLFFMDFQLSFGFTFILIWIAHINYLEKRL